MASGAREKKNSTYQTVLSIDHILSMERDILKNTLIIIV